MIILDIDAWILRKLQEAYLWLYDWTGIYVASVAAIVSLIGLASVGVTMLATVFVCFNLLVLIPYYVSQDKKQYAVHNARALMLRQSVVRYSCSFTFLLVCAAETIVKFTTDIVTNPVNTLMVWLYINLITVCIRDREPKDWFKRPKLATESC